MAKPKKNNPGPWDDIARGVGAVKRTIIGNPTNTNGASNLDKWLKGGRYRNPSITQMPSDLAKAGDYVIRKLTPLPDRKPTPSQPRGMNSSGQIVSGNSKQTDKKKKK